LICCKPESGCSWLIAN